MTTTANTDVTLSCTHIAVERGTRLRTLESAGATATIRLPEGTRIPKNYPRDMFEAEAGPAVFIAYVTTEPKATRKRRGDIVLPYKVKQVRPMRSNKNYWAVELESRRVSTFHIDNQTKKAWDLTIDQTVYVVISRA